MLRLGLLENKYTLAALLVLLLAFLMGLYSSYAATHPSVHPLVKTETVSFNSTIEKIIYPPELRVRGVITSLLNATLTLNSTGSIRVAISYVETPSLKEEVLLTPREELEVKLELLDGPPTLKCTFKPLEEGVWNSVTLRYRVLWESKSYMLYLSLPALFLAVLGATLGIIGYIRYVQRLVEEG